MAVKDFNTQSGDAAYTMGIVDLLLECVELSYRPGKFFFLDVRPGKYCQTFAIQMHFFQVEMD